MGIKAKFKQSDVKRRFDRFLAVVEKRQLDRFIMLGEMCVKHAREIPANVGFTDQTGNLRSSIGYVVFKDGEVVTESYSQIKGGADGVKQGRSLADTVRSKHPKGLLLVVTAGMNYALKLESRGKDVLTSAEQLAQTELPKMLEDLANNINQAFR